MSSIHLAFLAFLAFASSSFAQYNLSDVSLDSFGASLPHYLQHRAVPAGVSLTLLPVGDSITVGKEGSSDGNGYRLQLRNMLTGAGTPVNFIGSEHSGQNNDDPDHMGFGGYRINAILDQLKGGIMRQKPNLILIHAGTNDNNAEVNGETYAEAATRLSGMIDFVLCQDPDAVLLVAMLIQNQFNPSQTARFNQALPDIVSKKYAAGYKIRLVDMTPVKDDELSDILHPNDKGYKHMAEIWFQAISNIPGNWWSAPQAVKGPVETCARGKTQLLAANDGNFIAAGAHGEGDLGEEPILGSTFTPGWSDKGLIALGTGHAGSGVRFADLDGKSDYLWVDANTASVRAWLHPEEKTWIGLNGGNLIAFGTGKPDYVEFADLNNDKRADYIIVTGNTFKVYRNDGRNGDVWNWADWPEAAQQLNNAFDGNVGYHYFGDMNGDGRADLAIIRPNSVVDFYIQQGELGTASFSWKRCTNKGFFIPTMILADIDGDGRADYLTMDADGGIKGWLNKPGGECDITWIPINGGGDKSVALGAAPAGRVRVADLDGDGKADYMVIDDEGGAVRMWSNIGENHAARPTGLAGYGAGVRLADLDGDGRDDYLSVNSNGQVIAYLNGGETNGGWNWSPQGVVALGVADATRKMVQFADMNGDGLDDYLLIDEKSGAVKCWLNLKTNANTPWGWNGKGIIALGVGDVGTGVRFADLNGDGRADYIWLDENGAAKAWLNRGSGDVLTEWAVMNNGLVVALGVGAKREDVQFADVDGDGLADYLWIHPEDGSVDVWYNTGPLGSALGWEHGGRIASGIGYPGQNIKFARLGNSGRADYIGIEESTGALKAWINRCPEVIGTSGNFKGWNSDTCAGGPPLPPPSGPDESQPDPPPINCVGVSPDPRCIIPAPGPKCRDAGRYNTVDDVLNDSALPEACTNKYLLHALSKTMEGSLKQYSDILNDGYSWKFAAFAREARGQTVFAWESVWSSKEYWTCIQTTHGENATVDCKGNKGGTNYYYIPTDNFCDKLSKDHNVECEWLEYITARYNWPSCAGKGLGCPEDQKGDYTYPTINRQFSVPDPNTAISKAIDQYKDYSSWLSESAAEAQIDWYMDSEGDAVEASALLVYTLQAAAKSMDEVADLGEEAAEEQKRRTIVAFVSAFLFVIPGLGEALGATGAALQAIVRFARFADVAGNTALSVYGVVNDPSSAPEAVAGLLFGALGSRNKFAFKKAAGKSRSMSKEVLDSMGEAVANGVNGVRRSCKKCIE